MEKIILITGADKGIGKSSAEKLATEGNIVYGADITFDNTEELSEKGVICIKMDVTDNNQVLDSVKKIIDTHGRIDGLFANAGRAILGMTELVSVEDAKELYDVNVFGVLRCIKAVLPYMRNASPGGKGHILVTSSNFSHKALPGLSTYSSSKSALEAIFNSLEDEIKILFPGIKMVVIEPGFIKTNLYRSCLKNWLKAMRHSEVKAYEKSMKNLFKEFNNEYHVGDSVEKVSEIVSNVFNSKTPCTRYTCGKKLELK
jgi:NADP-dependent 3-hydroxy acid dehydrogenase YdfG